MRKNGSKPHQPVGVPRLGANIDDGFYQDGQDGTIDISSTELLFIAMVFGDFLNDLSQKANDFLANLFANKDGAFAYIDNKIKNLAKVPDDDIYLFIMEPKHEDKRENAASRNSV